jgi:hypothetical protein
MFTGLGVRAMMFNTILNNILVDETGVPGENY